MQEYKGSDVSNVIITELDMDQNAYILQGDDEGPKQQGSELKQRGSVPMHGFPVKHDEIPQDTLYIVKKVDAPEVRWVILVILNYYF